MPASAMPLRVKITASSRKRQFRSISGLQKEGKKTERIWWSLYRCVAESKSLKLTASRQNKQEKQIGETQNRSDLVENEEFAVAFARHVLQRFVGMENIQIEALHELIDRDPQSRFLAFARSQIAVRNEDVGQSIHCHALHFGRFILFENHAEKQRRVLQRNVLRWNREKEATRFIIPRRISPFTASQRSDETVDWRFGLMTCSKKELRAGW